MNEPSSIRVFVVDDHSLVRDMLSARLQQEHDFVVAGTAHNAEDALTSIRAEHPDVVIMDVDMPGLNSFEAARAISSEAPRTHILFLSAYTNDRYIDEALQVGAVGYLTKDEPPENVATAIRSVMDGNAYYSESVQSRIVIDEAGARLASDAQSRINLLSTREREVLSYLAKGLSKKEIAGIMHLSVKTVEGHTEKVMKKLDIHDRVQLSRFAIREGLVEA